MKHSPGFLRIVDDARTRIRELTVDDVKSMLGRGERFHLVDVREESEWDKGHLPTARHLCKGILEREERGPAVTGIENARLDTRDIPEETIEMPGHDDLVARRILRIERDELFEQRHRIALGGISIEARSALSGDTGDEENDDEQGP